MRAAADHTDTAHRSRGARTLLGVVALTAVALVGCSSDGSDASASTTTEAPVTTSTTEASATTEPAGEGTPNGDDGCPTTDDVAEVLGGPVDDTSSGGGSAGDLTWSYQGCGYDQEDGDGSVGIARVTVDRSTVSADAASETDFALLEADARADFADDGFEPITDLGDDAHRDGRGVAVRHGAQLFLVAIEDRGGPGDDEDDDTEDPAGEARAVAVEVLDVDLSVGGDALCAPLQDAVEAALGGTIGGTPRSGSVGVDEVSFETEGCAVDLGDGREVDIDVAPSDDWDAWVRAKQASGLDEQYRATSIGELAAFTSGDGLFVDDGERPLLVTTEDLGLEPAAEDDLRVALAELALGA